MIKCTPPPAPLAAPTRQKLLVRHSSCATRSPLAPPGAPSLKIEYAVVAELVDALDSGSSGFTAVGVRVSPTAPPKALVFQGFFIFGSWRSCVNRPGGLGPAGRWRTRARAARS